MKFGLFPLVIVTVFWGSTGFSEHVSTCYEEICLGDTLPKTGFFWENNPEYSEYVFGWNDGDADCRRLYHSGFNYPKNSNINFHENPELRNDPAFDLRPHNSVIRAEVIYTADTREILAVENTLLLPIASRELSIEEIAKPIIQRHGTPAFVVSTPPYYNIVYEVSPGTRTYVTLEVDYYYQKPYYITFRAQKNAMLDQIISDLQACDS